MIDLPTVVIGVLNAAIVGMIGWLGRSLRCMRVNDLNHLQRSLDRIEAKLDAHIAYHLEKGL